MLRLSLACVVHTCYKSSFYMSPLLSITFTPAYRPGPSCSKLTMSLVNDWLKFTSSDTQICWNFLLKKNVSSFCSAKATHMFSAKNIRILCIGSAKTVNEMTLNDVVNLTTLWTTGPSCRVRVTDRHCRHLRRKIKFGTKNHKLAKTSGEKNIAWITCYWAI